LRPVVAYRPAHAEDAAAIIALNRRVAADSAQFLAYDIDPISGADMLQAKLGGEPGEGGRDDQVLVAILPEAKDDNTAVVGVALLRRHRHPAFAGVLQFSLAVDPALRRQGIGRALTDLAVASAKTSGARRLQLAVIDGNAAALRLFETSGFVQEGRLSGAAEIAGRLHDLLAMGMPLDDLPAASPSI